MQLMPFRSQYYIQINFMLKFLQHGKYHVTLQNAASLSRLKLIFCIHLASGRVRVSTNTGIVKKNVAMSRRATLSSGIPRRHFTNRVLPACLIYRNPKGEA